MSQQLFPGDFAARQAGHAAQHAAQRRFHAGCDLIVAVARGDAFDEGPLLFAVGKSQVVAEGSSFQPTGPMRASQRDSALFGVDYRAVDETRLSGNSDEIDFEQR